MKFDTPLPLTSQCTTYIDVNEVANGIALTIKNAKDLLEDAQLLFDNHRYPRALTLAILAIEESGKVHLLKNLLLDKQRVSSLWKKVRSHTSKNYHWLYPILKELGTTDMEVIMDLSKSDSNSVKFLDQLKQISLYTEAIKTEDICEWWLPSSIVDHATAEAYLTTAYKVVLDDGILWTSEALEVFKQHMYYKDGDVHCEDLIAYYDALLRGGHITEARHSKIKANVLSLHS